MREEQPLIAQPGTPAWHRPDDPLTVVSQLDGSAVVVGTQPGADTDTPVVVLRLQSPLLELVNAVYLPPGQARQVADALDTAATAAATAQRARQPGASGGAGQLTRSPGASPGPALGAGPSGTGWADADSAERVAVTVLHTVTAGERVTAGALRDALGHLPSTARLTDFAADSEVILIFASA